MTTYYIRTIGDDANDGLSPGAAWKTMQHATETVSADDTVYLGAGIHRGFVMLDASGSSGNPIKWIGDITGVFTGDEIGNVCVAADKYQEILESDRISVARDEHWASERTLSINKDVTYNEFYNIYFLGADQECFSAESTAEHDAGYTTWGMEGFVFEECTFSGANKDNDEGIQLDLKATASLTDGFLFDRCVFYGGVRLRVDENVTAECDYNSSFESCVFAANFGNYQLYIGRALNSTYAFTGIDVISSGFYWTPNYGTSFVSVSDGAAQKMVFHNSLYVGAYYDQATDADVDMRGSVTSYGDLASVGVDWGDDIEVYRNVYVPLGGSDDLFLYQHYGYSPYKMWEIITWDNIPTMCVIGRDTNTNSTYDLYGEKMTGYAHGWFARGTDDPTIDYNVDLGIGEPWTNMDNVIDNDFDSYSSGYYSDTVETPEYIHVRGYDSVIDDVYGEPAEERGPFFLMALYTATGVVIYATMYVGAVEIEPEMILFTASTNQYSVKHFVKYDTNLADVTYTDWDRAKLTSAELRMWKQAQGTLNFYIFALAMQWRNGVNIGPVVSRGHAAPESTIVQTGLSMKMVGRMFWHFAGWQNDGSYTVAVKARYDSNYTAGTLPRLVVNTPVDGNTYSDTMTGAVDTWEELTVNITVAAGQPVVIRLESEDTSAQGYCYFDDLTVE